MQKPIESWLITIVALAASLTATATPSVDQQRHFATPGSAVEALIAANRQYNPSRLLAILGVDGIRLIRSGDPVADEHGRQRLVADFDRAHTIELDGRNQAVLIVGPNRWPLPIPLIREPTGWRFDTRAAEQEILDRRVGRDELEVIQICRTYVQAQREYAALKIGGQAEFASRFNSTRGRHDGLYWPAKIGDPDSPLGPLVAQAQAAGYAVGNETAAQSAPRPYYGYYFRILTAQGPNAAGGAKSYLVAGRMTQGFALLAYPASFGNSGIMTFIVNQNGIVFQKNLGPDTTRLARQLSRYDPDGGWRAP